MHYSVVETTWLGWFAFFGQQHQPGLLHAHKLAHFQPCLLLLLLLLLLCRLSHLQPSDLSVLPQLRSLFCLALSAPLNESGQIKASSPQPPVRLSQVFDVVRDSLPYCDLQLQAEPGA
jgi:hypothetical protein